MKPAPIQYRVVPESPDGHHFLVSLRVADPSPEGTILSLPNWTPGSYLIRDFSKQVLDVSAEDGAGRPVSVTKLDKSRWSCRVADGPLFFQFRFHARDLSVRSAYLDRHYGFFNGTSLLPAVEGQKDEVHGLELIAPAAGCTSAPWHVATTLVASAVDAAGFGHYRADNYAVLVDHPVALAAFCWVEFEVAGVPHRIALSGEFRADLTRLKKDVRAICSTQVMLFGELPVNEYLFQLHITGNGYGGLEHRASSSLLASRAALPPPDDEPRGDELDHYNNLLGLFSHEYFHLWHVKRIRPAAFIPMQLQREVHTNLLWVFEGFTSYYDDLGVLRAGAMDRPAYLKQLGRTITRVWRGSGRRRQSVVESSFDAWTRFYQQDANAANAIVSYYTKGALIALALDLLLRRDHDSSLDTIMVTLWQRYGSAEPGDADLGVAEDGLELLLREVAGPALDGFLQRCVHGTEDPPLAGLLADFGLELHARPRQGLDDRGGSPASPQCPVPPRIGLTTEAAFGQLRVTTVQEDSPAEQAGLAPDDLLVALDGFRVTDGLEPILRRCIAGEPVSLHYFRGDVLFAATLIPRPPEDDTWYITVTESPSDKALNRLEGWLAND